VFKTKKIKEKSCKSCRIKFVPTRPLQVVCSPGCAYSLVMKNKEKEKKKEVKDWNKEKRERKDKLKTLSDYEAEARKVFQKWIRERDKNLPCISCNKSTSKIWDGGHLFKAELYSGLMFDERNVHKQCRKCNYYFGGNEAGYKDGLDQRYGPEFVDALEKDKDGKRVYKYSKEELIQIKKTYQKKYNEIKD
jgi:hypothetical protein